jgi:phosphate/phosphite/phosphonate ABC transporter binding protein
MLVVGCAPSEDRSAPVTPRSRPSMPVFAAPVGFERVRFGLVPFLSSGTISAAHGQLAAYLSRALTVPVDVVVGDSYTDAIDRLARGEFELVELSPYAYALATQRVKLKCLVQSIADGSVTTSGYIFVREDSPRRTVADLKGATFAFVDPVSTSGYLFARKILKDNGIDYRKDLARTEFAGNHEAVLLAVMEGRVDAGATYQGAFAALKRSKGVDPLTFRIIAKSSRTPRDILCARADVPDAVVEAMTRALLALDGRSRAGREILGPLNLNGFQPADDSAYDEVRRVAAELGPQ